MLLTMSVRLLGRTSYNHLLSDWLPDLREIYGSRDRQLGRRQERSRR